VTDRNNYTYYAGPVRGDAPGVCIKRASHFDEQNWTSAWSHCGWATVLVAVAFLAGCQGVGSPHVARTGTVTMPNLVGKNAATAKDDLERLGFADDRIKLSPRGHLFVAMPSHWAVDAQSEKPGARVDLQGLIVLSVSKWS